MHEILTRFLLVLAFIIPQYGKSAELRNNRYALMIGIGEYTKSGIQSLAGVKFDIQSAKLMASSMGIPEQNIQILQNANATAEHIRESIKQLNQRLLPGDRLFVYYSGHGTRWYDPNISDGVCTEGLVATDGEVLSNKEIGKLLRPISEKTDKLIVFYDACFSGGVVSSPLTTRSISLNRILLTPKVTPSINQPECSIASNFKTRSLNTVMLQQGLLPQNIVHIAASRADEVSFDNADQGGMATVAWRDCLLGQAKDNNQLGVITVQDITSCAQKKLDQTFSNMQGDVLSQHMIIGGNKHFVPALIKADFMPLSNIDVSQKINPAVVLEQIHEQRDAGRKIEVSVDKSRLKIGVDQLKISIKSSQNGYLYIALAGSDQKSLYLLYPNKLDGNNAIKAGQTINLPPKSWAIDAAGPVGTDTLFVMLTDSPRKIEELAFVREGPFMKTLLDGGGLSLLQSVLATSSNSEQSRCQQTSGLRNLKVARQCSDAFGSEIIKIEENK
jgi:hypothetical protein